MLQDRAVPLEVPMLGIYPSSSVSAMPYSLSLFLPVFFLLYLLRAHHSVRARYVYSSGVDRHGPSPQKAPVYWRYRYLECRIVRALMKEHHAAVRSQKECQRHGH